MGWTRVPVAPATMMSAMPRWIVTAASPRARWPLASRTVRELLGPRRSLKIAMWLPGMLGRYLSSQSGLSRGMPSVAQRVKSKPPSVPRQAAMPAVKSSGSVSM